MQLHNTGTDPTWRLEGRYDQDSLLKIQQKLTGLKQQGDLILDVADLETINAPVIALLLELRRHSRSLTLARCRDDYREMLQLYGLENMFDFA
ncbi:STAS domain-containing protein [Marinomonas ostreistagni]|uniref:STAS domain-containing protein n=1 Tax=Marinomonas ostreistagni TaxID=359209 RepID=UPI00194E2FA9|nr:STAS domain-containing protein [Marinomonas ostreistagni]MBM6549861.1 STAS domain-containing protein [Marinomonas ostreistagni]